jgi:hypothetical protein
MSNTEKFYSSKLQSEYESMIDNIKRSNFPFVPESLLDINIFVPDTNPINELTPKDYIDLSTEQLKIKNKIDKLNKLNDDLTGLSKLLDHARARKIDIDRLNALFQTLEIDYDNIEVSPKHVYIVEIPAKNIDLRIITQQVKEQSEIVALFIIGDLPKEFKDLKFENIVFYCTEEMEHFLTGLDFKLINERLYL